MSITRLLGIVLLVGGIVLIGIGLVAKDSLADGLSSFFTGHYTKHTLWYLFGGLASAAVGLVLLLGVFGQKKS